MTALLRTLVAVALALTIAGVPAQAATNQLEQRLSQLSERGSGEAAYHLGMLYHMGLAGVEKDPRRAFALFKLAADRGDPLGAYKVGCYYDGQGEGVVESNPTLALRYKLIAAEAGYALAQQDVAIHFLNESNDAGAIRWLEAAAAQGSRTPLLILGLLYRGIEPQDAVVLPKVPKDVVKGWAYLLLSARDVPEMTRAYEAELAKLPAEQQRLVRAFVATWKDKPSRLTEQDGINEAYKLAGLPVPNK